MTAAGTAPERRPFRDLLETQWDRGRFVSVGLDPVWDKLPDAIKAGVDGGRDTASRAFAIAAFCKAIVDATADLACAFKPNAAFFEAFGAPGAEALSAVLGHIGAVAPEVPVIYDAKRGDIGSTNQGYAVHAFDELRADAITVHPYLGREALDPFLERLDKGTIVLVRTSNPGGGEFQDLMVGDELAEVRRIVGTMPILIPGIGAQGGDVRRTVEAGRDARRRGMIVNSSRGVIYASNGDDFAEAARQEVLRLNREIESYR